MKKTVFISSTFEDLKEHRSAVWDLLNFHYDVEIKGMEDFGARKESPLETCLSEVEQSDIYVGLIGTRLGSINEDKGKSYTQLEYEKALEKNKEILIYIIDEENAKTSPNLVDKGEKYIKLISFKNKLKKTHTVDFFVDAKDLVKKLKRKFNERLNNKKEAKKDSLDEIQFSQKVIEEFELFPKSRSGQEVKLKGIFEDEFYPASKDICHSFNKAYGSTVIVNLEVKAPLNGSIFDKILVNHNQFEKVKEAIGREVEFYVSLLFTEDTINQFKAYFRRETQTYFDVGHYLANDLINNPLLAEKTVVHEREGTIILSLNELNA